MCRKLWGALLRVAGVFLRKKYFCFLRKKMRTKNVGDPPPPNCKNAVDTRHPPPNGLDQSWGVPPGGPVTLIISVLFWGGVFRLFRHTSFPWPLRFGAPPRNPPFCTPKMWSNFFYNGQIFWGFFGQFLLILLNKNAWIYFFFIKKINIYFFFLKKKIKYFFLGKKYLSNNKLPNKFS